MSKVNAPKKTRQRSPNYPAISLRQAVERVQKIYKQDGKAGAPMDVALRLIGFSKAHGQAMTIVSALRKFGLIEDKGGRMIPSQLAIDIIEFPEDHARHIAAAQEAALSPQIYSELVDSYKGAGVLPSDDSLKPELITDMDFNPKAVNKFLIDFKDTLRYAGLLVENELVSSKFAFSILEDQGMEHVKDARPAVANSQTEATSQPQNQFNPPAAPSETKPGMRAFDLPLFGADIATIKVPFPLSEDNFDALKAMLEAMRPTLTGVPAKRGKR